jgi:hypothetical protein
VASGGAAVASITTTTFGFLAENATAIGVICSISLVLVTLLGIILNHFQKKDFKRRDEHFMMSNIRKMAQCIQDDRDREEFLTRLDRRSKPR